MGTALTPLRTLRDWCIAVFLRCVGAPALGHIPGPRGLAFVRLMLHFVRDSLGALERTHALYGPLVSYPWPVSTVIAYDPNDVDHVLVDRGGRYEKGAQTEALQAVMGTGLVTNNDRPSWRARRPLVAKALGSSAVRAYAPTFFARADDLVEAWDTATADGERELDVSEAMQRVTFAIASETLLGRELSDADAKRVDEAIRFTARVVHGHMFQLLPLPYAVPTRAHRRFHAHCRDLDVLVYRLIDAARGRARLDDGSILERLVDARDPDTGAGLEDEVLRDEVLTLLIAGYETTASTLCWVLTMLAAHPEIQAQVREEARREGARVDSLGARTTHPLTFAVIAESMRLYTAIPMSSRRTLAPDTLSGYAIPAGTNVVVPVWVLHRGGSFAAPERFRPDRFEGCPAHRHAGYVPFSKGDRACVGKTFALVEVAAVLAHIVARFELRLAEQGVPAAESHVSLQPRGGLRLRVRRAS
ncbi:MAG: cytochrome P450 [Sandaracinaceae bacterium]